MRIALDARELSSPEPRGGGRYLLGLLRSLLARDDDVQYLLLSWGRLQHDFGDSRIEVTIDAGPRGSRFRVWDQWTLPRLVRRLSPSLLHCPVNLAPLLMSRPTVVTVHDTVMLHRRGEATRAEFLYTRRLLPPALRRARIILTVSQSSARDITRDVGIPPERIVVTHPGLGPGPDPAQPAALPPELGIEPGYVFHLGATDPRKNTGRLLESYADLVRRDPAAPLLVVAGLQTRGRAALERRATRLDIGARVRILGYVPDDTLHALYANARVFCYPSSWEGFGFPALESMRAGCPVVAARATSIPEVVGDAALLVEPHDRQVWAQAMARALSDSELRRGLRERGHRRVEAFRWEVTAERTFAAYRRAVEGGGTPEKTASAARRDPSTRRSARTPNA